MWSGTVVLISVLAVSSASLSLRELEQKPDKFKDKEGCYIGELDAVLPFGTSQPSIKGCKEYRCTKNSKYLSIASCGLAKAAPPFEVVQDKEKPYPDCCPRIQRSLVTKE